ncbi:MAG: exodeoxyribonuclease III [Deltaproteobacteria bacterium]|nr:exodeoxyribonuclease III [Deltaproteobacteria bacterium]
MRIASWNVNGLRSVLGKGLLDWMAESDLDLVMLQEVKAKPDVLAEVGDFYKDLGFKSIGWAKAEKNGYSGLLTLSKMKDVAIREGLGIENFDREGRWLETDLGPYTFINSYFPNSQRDHARLPFKLEFCRAAQNRMERLLKLKRIPILGGDINVAHTEIDLANPKTNKDNAGFLPEEREWFSNFLDAGWSDAFRILETAGGHYTWWSYRPGVREKNIGWRLDHFFLPAFFKSQVNWVRQQPEVRGSDHCPVVISVPLSPNL